MTMKNTLLTLLLLASTASLTYAQVEPPKAKPQNASLVPS
jgi:hypothetical protein